MQLLGKETAETFTLRKLEFRRLHVVAPDGSEHCVNAKLMPGGLSNFKEAVRILRDWLKEHQDVDVSSR